MTNEQVNREIAEKICKWYLYGKRWYDTNKELAFVDALWSESYFNPSERLDHAWMVMEKSNAFFELFNNPIKKIWVVKFHGMDDFVVANTAPLAICLAALEAVKEE